MLKVIRIYFAFPLPTALCDMLANLAPLSQQWEVKPKPVMNCSQAFYRAWRWLHVFPSNSDWFIEIFASVVIVQGNNFGVGKFYDTQMKTAFCIGCCNSNWTRTWHSYDYRFHGSPTTNFTTLSRVKLSAGCAGVVIGLDNFILTR